MIFKVLVFLEVPWARRNNSTQNLAQLSKGDHNSLANTFCLHGKCSIEANYSFPKLATRYELRLKPFPIYSVQFSAFSAFSWVEGNWNFSHSVCKHRSLAFILSFNQMNISINSGWLQSYQLCPRKPLWKGSFFAETNQKFEPKMEPIQDMDLVKIKPPT